MVAPSRSWGDKIGASGGNSTRSGSAGRPGGVGNVGQTNSKPTTTSYGAPIHEDNSSNPVTRGITLAAGPELHQKNVLRTDVYNDAARKWNESAKTRSFANLLNNLSPMGFAMEPPDVKRPSTFSEGDYHLGWNPGSLVGLATGAVLPGSGFITGPLGQAAYSAAGGKNLMLSGAGDMGMQTWKDLPSGPSTPSQNQAPGDRTSQSMAAFQGPTATAPGGAPFGAQPAQPAADPMSAFFRPKVPNHTVPQGFQSAFPNSLSAEDMALLYGQALAK